ncbi:hypothetical protein NE237_032902 [Protea cynaroides]|uniref:F-box/LRR-repeat protein n=1 Tax=Protea cynaroides TaxID=273540 RepID=A0A9Q0R416_9MAGN|nr:hypothetical protein NE237_032902 [Protea cynaroides]
MLPHLLFTCKSLRVLKLDLGSNSKRPQLILPDSSALTGLKTLHLGSFSLVDGELAGKFFSSRPVLEKLMITNCNLMTMKDLHISSLLLKKLVIEISVEDHKSFDHIQDFNGPTVYIDLFLENHLDNELTTLPSESREEHAKYVVDWLRRLYDVKALSLSSMFIWSLETGLFFCSGPAKVLAGNSFQVCIWNLWLSNVLYLKMKTRLHTDSICGLLYLLKRCPGVESLVFEIAGKKYLLSPIYQSWDEAKLNIPTKLYWESLFPLNARCIISSL